MTPLRGVVLFLVVVFVAPVVINVNLAKSRGKSVPLMLLLTIIFSWIVTLILAFIPKEDE